MAKNVNKEIETIEEKAKASIDLIIKETNKKLKQDLIKLEATMMAENLSNLNIHESEKVNQINQAVALKKNECEEDFIQYFKDLILERIENNFQQYSLFNLSKIMEYLPLIDRPVQVHFSKLDLEKMKKNDFFNPIPKDHDMIRLSDEPIDTVCGFKIISDDGLFTIDYTYESLIKRYKQELSMKLMQIFPIFDINVKNALEIDEQKHGDAQRYEK